MFIYGSQSGNSQRGFIIVHFNSLGSTIDDDSYLSMHRRSRPQISHELLNATLDGVFIKINPNIRVDGNFNIILPHRQVKAIDGFCPVILVVTTFPTLFFSRAEPEKSTAFHAFFDEPALLSTAISQCIECYGKYFFLSNFILM